MELCEGMASWVVMTRHVEETYRDGKTEEETAHHTQQDKGGILVSIHPTAKGGGKRGMIPPITLSFGT